MKSKLATGAYCGLKSIFWAVVASLIVLQVPAANAHLLDTEPVWCDPDNKGTDGEPVPGKFPGPREHRGMNRVELGSFDLAEEIPDLPGRQARVRYWLMEPGGMIAEHCHSDRPAYVYLLQGEVVETKEADDGEYVKKTIRAGQAALEGNGTRHWWVNQTDQNVLMVAVDLPNSNKPHPAKHPEPGQNSGTTIRDLGTMPLQEQHPHIPGVANYGMRGRLFTVAPGGKIGLTYHNKQPGFAYVIDGLLLEHRADVDVTVVRRAGALSATNKGIWNYWENKSKSEATLFVFDLVDCGASCSPDEIND